MNQLLILTEAGQSIGYGHYMRCSALQKEAQNQDIHTKMILYVKGNEKFDVDGGICNWLDKNKLEKLLETEKQFDAIVVDSYLADEEVYHFLKTKFEKVIVIDDYNRIKYDADLIINPNVFFEQIDYSNQKAKCVGGKEFVLLRSIFTSLKNNTEDNTENTVQSSEKAESILITIGGTDFRNLLPQLIQICLNQKLRKIQVICPQENQRKELENTFHKSEKNKDTIEILGKQSAQEMYNLYQKNDSIISACGQTLHELASQGKPTIGICLAIDQVPNQKYYLEKHFLLENLNWNDKDLEEKISSQINSFQNYHLKQLIQNYAPLLVGKNGLSNVVDVIKKVENKEIVILTSSSSWLYPLVQKWLENYNTKHNLSIKLYDDHKNINGNKEIVFFLSYFKIVPKEFLDKNSYNLVIHESALPKGKGWAPLFWQILEGKNTIPIVIFEATEEVDAGKIYYQDSIELKGYELHDEIRYLQASKTFQLVESFLEGYHKSELQGKEQKGISTYYPKRTPLHSELDINKTIKQQFLQMRIANNEEFPLFFKYLDKKYILKIFLEKNTKNDKFSK